MARGGPRGQGCLVRLGRGLARFALVVAALTGAAYYYLSLPDLPPLRLPPGPAKPAAAHISARDLPPPSRMLRAPPPPLPASRNDASVAAVRQSLDTMRIPYHAVFAMPDRRGTALVVSVRYERILKGDYPGEDGLYAGYAAIVQIAGARTIDLAPYRAVVVIIDDSRNRALLVNEALVPDMLMFRAGALPQRTLIQRTAGTTSSRAALLAVLQQVVLRRAFGL